MIKRIKVNESPVFIEELVPSVRNRFQRRLIGAGTVGLLDPGETELENPLHEKLGGDFPGLAIIKKLLNGRDPLIDPTEFH